MTALGFNEIPPWAAVDVVIARRGEALERRWEPKALCRGLTPQAAGDLFFPYRAPVGSTVAKLMRTTVDQWCARCPVNTDCAAASITEADGVFGSTPTQRRALRRALRERGVEYDVGRNDPRIGLPRSDSALRAARARA